jgi:PiT family inorganic phosphate transporter
VNWSQVGTIAVSWIISPLLAGTISYALFMSVKILILDTDDPFARSRRLIPLYIWAVGFMISMVTVLKGLKHLGLNLDFGLGSEFANALPLSFVIGLIVAAIGVVLLRAIKFEENEDNRYASVENMFGVLMMFTACAMAFAHGSNDVANAVGPLAAIANLVQSGGQVAATSAMPPWILLIGALGIVVGLTTYGWKVIATVGNKITELTPSRGCAATLAAASTVVIASATGLPISTTHTLVGAVLGVGLARGIAAIDLRVIGSIFVSWIITLPAGAILAVIFFYTLRGIYG